MKAQYRLQLDCPGAPWTEWRDINVKPTEESCLSVQISEFVTKEQYREFMKCFTTSGKAN